MIGYSHPYHEGQKMSKANSGCAFILSLDIARKSSTEEPVQSSKRELLSFRVNVASLSEDRIARRIVLRCIAAKITISCCNLQTRGVSTKPLRNDTRAHQAQNEKKEPTLSLNPLSKMYSHIRNRHI